MKNLLLKTFSIFSIVLSLSNIAYAEDAVYLPKAQPAPYTGILMPEDEAQQLRKDSIEKDSLSKSVDLYKSNELLYAKKIDVLSEQNDKLAKTAFAERNLDTWEKIGYFSLGAVLTGLVAYGIYRTH